MFNKHPAEILTAFLGAVSTVFIVLNDVDPEIAGAFLGAVSLLPAAITAFVQYVRSFKDIPDWPAEALPDEGRREPPVFPDEH